VKKEAKLSASEVPGEVVGSGEEDLRCRSLLTVCQRRLGLSEAEDTRLEKYSFFRTRMFRFQHVLFMFFNLLV